MSSWKWWDNSLGFSELLPHVRVTKGVLSVNVLVCRLVLVREAL